MSAGKAWEGSTPYPAVRLFPKKRMVFTLVVGLAAVSVFFDCVAAFSLSPHEIPISNMKSKQVKTFILNISSAI
jgi:hypothetical protein